MAVERWDEYEDAELVAEVLLGDATAFDTLVQRYRPAVLAAVMRRVSTRVVAEDVCQEAFLRAFRALPRLQDPSRFAAWLHAIARREVVRHGPGEARAASHAPLDEESMEQHESMDSSVWETVQRREEGEWVRQAMEALPEAFQLVLTLRYWSELPVERIAAFLGRPVTTVKWRLHRARALLRQQLTATQTDDTIHQRRNCNEPRNERPEHRTAAHRTDVREDRGDGARCRNDGQPGGSERGGGAQLQRDRAALDRHRGSAGGPVRAAAG